MNADQIAASIAQGGTKTTLHDGLFVRDMQKCCTFLTPSSAKRLQHWDIDVTVHGQNVVVELWTDRGERTRQGEWVEYNSAIVRVARHGLTTYWSAIPAYQFAKDWGALQRALTRFFKRHPELGL